MTEVAHQNQNDENYLTGRHDWLNMLERRVYNGRFVWQF